MFLDQNPFGYLFRRSSVFLKTQHEFNVFSQLSHYAFLSEIHVYFSYETTVAQWYTASFYCVSILEDALWLFRGVLLYTVLNPLLEEQGLPPMTLIRGLENFASNQG